MNNYFLNIVEIRRESSDACTICFKQPGLRKIRYKAGQYITLNLKINGRKYSRAYSFSSSPSINSFLEVTVKMVAGGIVSNYINKELKVGDVVEVSEPMGNFILGDLNSQGLVYLWGVGSGITPLFSIINELLSKSLGKSIHLIYGNKNIESTIFYNQLKELEKKYSVNFKVTNFYSEIDIEIENVSINKGRINSTFVETLISTDNIYKDSIHYICGPSGLKNIIKSVLIDFEIPSNSIYIEEFQLVIDPIEFNLIENSNVKIFFKGNKFDVFVPKGKNILEVALDQDIEIPYSCQTGNCNTCKARVSQGQLKMLGLDTQKYNLAKNEFLLCCSYPLTNEVILELE
jgi:ring-1,2-phenylacetyl-CoA epoxidase subunit PaaE